MRIISRFITSLGSLTLALCSLMMLASCDVHQWPEPNNEPDPDVPEKPEKTTAAIKLHLQYFTDFTISNHVYDMKSGAVTKVNDGDTYDNLENIAPGTPIKVTVKVHTNNSNRTLVLNETFLKELDTDYDTDVEIELPLGQEYLVTAWGHLLDNEGNAFYDESDFNSIALIKERFTLNTDLRDAFRGRLNIAVPDEDNIEGTVNMRRPICKLEFVTTDLQEFLANEEQRVGLGSRSVSADDYKVVISYPFYYPSNYMAMEDRLEFADTGYNFSTSIRMASEEDTESSLAFDYVMINNTDDAKVQAQVTLYHKDGTLISSTGTINVPMQRDHHIVLRGKFLTANGNGGVGIDPDFDGEFNIPVY